MSSLDFGIPVTQIIRERRSRRTYDDRPIDPQQLSSLEAYSEALQSLESPFGERARFGLIDKMTSPDKPIRLGTYGLLKNPRYFLFGFIPESKHDYTSFGYLFQHLILKATELGLSTCWFGYYHKNSFLEEISPPPGEVVPAVCSVGHGAGRQSTFESIIRRKRKPLIRRPWGELFFVDTFAQALDSAGAMSEICGDDAAAYATAFEMIRLAPSAGNHQPWRVIAKTSPFEILFYLDRTDASRGYEKRNLQALDIGIAMCHFDLAVRSAGITGTWSTDDTGTPESPPRTEFVIRWRP